MKNLQTKVITAVLVAIFAFPFMGSAQEGMASELSYEVNIVYPALSMTKEKVHNANTVVELNHYYKPAWVRTFSSVEIITIHNGKTRKAISDNDILSPEQKDNMKTADAGSDISVDVYYIPENTLSHNDMKLYDFTFQVDPDQAAAYPRGDQHLSQYIKNQAINNIPEGTITGYGLAAVKFVVNPEGQIINAHIFESSKNEQVDALLLKTIQDMPTWTPAEYANGLKVNQEYVLTVGNMENCVVNLLNMR